MTGKVVYQGTLGDAKKHFLDLVSELNIIIAEYGIATEMTVSPIADGDAGEAWLVVKDGIDAIPVLRVFFYTDKNCRFPMVKVLPRAEAHLNKTQATPPINAEFLFFLFMTPQNCDALVGDLEERFKLIHKKFGRRRANFWYWLQIFVSLRPIVWEWAKGVSLKPVMALIGWAVAKGLIGHDGWLAGLLELWKRVRS